MYRVNKFNMYFLCFLSLKKLIIFCVSDILLFTFSTYLFKLVIFPLCAKSNAIHSFLKDNGCVSFINFFVFLFVRGISVMCVASLMLFFENHDEFVFVIFSNDFNWCILVSDVSLKKKESTSMI